MPCSCSVLPEGVMDFAHRASLAGLMVLMSAAAHAGSAGSSDGYSRLAQTISPGAAAPPESGDPAAPAVPPASAPPPEAAAPPETLPAMEKPLPGDRWVYELKDEITGEAKGVFTYVVTEVRDKEIVIRATSSSQPNPWTIVFDHNWGMLDNGLWKFSPSHCLGRIVPPLNPGKQWHCGNESRNTKTGAARREAVQAKVVDKENVTTEAGSFDTFRIVYVQKLAGADRPLGTSVDMLYAPAINHWIERRERFYVGGRLQTDETMELTDYSRKP